MKGAEAARGAAAAEAAVEGGSWTVVLDPAALVCDRAVRPLQGAMAHVSQSPAPTLICVKTTDHSQQQSSMRA